MTECESWEVAHGVCKRWHQIAQRSLPPLFEETREATRVLNGFFMNDDIMMSRHVMRLVLRIPSSSSFQICDIFGSLRGWKGLVQQIANDPRPIHVVQEAIKNRIDWEDVFFQEFQEYPDEQDTDDNEQDTDEEGLNAPLGRGLPEWLLQGYRKS